MAVCGTIVIFKVSQLIEKYTKHLSNILAWYGKNSMFILLLHYSESELVRYERMSISNNIYINKTEVGSLKIFIITLGTMIIDSSKKLIDYIKGKIKNQEA